MDITFVIVLNVRTPEGFSRFWEFDVGADHEAVEALYASLEGREPEGDEGFLHLDMVEMRHGLPFNVHVLNCSAAELARNVYKVTMQFFRWKNLDQHMPE